MTISNMFFFFCNINSKYSSFTFATDLKQYVVELETVPCVHFHNCLEGLPD